MAITMWFIVAREETTEAVFPTQIEFVNIPSSLEITGDPPSQAEIRVRASSTLMRRINEAGLTARVDLRDVRPGAQRITLDANSFDLPLGCQLIKVRPPEFILDLEEKESRAVVVSPRIEGRAADGFEVVAITTTPDRVVVEGPRTHVKRLSAVTTDPVSVDGLVTSISERVGLRVPDPACRIVGENTAQLDLTIVEKQETRSIDGILVLLEPPSVAANITPQRVRVDIQGPISKIRLLGPNEIRARVAVGSLRAGTYSLAPTIVFSTASEQSFRVLEVDPANVRVQIRGAQPSPRK